MRREEERALCTTDEELSHAYQKFLLRAIQAANDEGLAGRKIVRLSWYEDMTTGRKYLTFHTQR